MARDVTGSSAVNRQTIEGEVTFGRKHRVYKIEVGLRYVVDPLNPAKLRNRGRECVVLDFVPVSESHPRDFVAKVRYLDNNRIGLADPDDLVPIPG